MGGNALLLALGYRGAEEPDALLASYLRDVANGGLCRYKSVIQRGGKAGEPLYVHVLNGVLTAERLRSLVGLSDAEARVLYSAFSVHDVNKVVGEEGPPRGFNRLAEPGRIEQELEAVGIPAFFPAYREHIEDICLLVRSHSAHYSTAAEGLIPAFHPYRLPRQRLVDVLVPLMRGLDLLALSARLEEGSHKEAFLGQLHRVASGRYRWVRHRVTEQRGLLTNVVHNAVVDFLRERFGLIPLLIYPEGVAYLAPAEGRLDALPIDGAAMGSAVVDALSQKSRRDFAKFIRRGPSGIVVGPECLQVGLGFDAIFGVVFNLVASRLAARRYDMDGTEAKARTALERERDRSGVPAALAAPAIVPRTQEGMAAGELLCAYYIFLNDHLGDRIGPAWPYLYKWLGLDPGRQPHLEALDPRYLRAYAVAQALGLVLEDLYPRILADGEALMGDRGGGGGAVTRRGSGTAPPPGGRRRGTPGGRKVPGPAAASSLPAADEAEAEEEDAADGADTAGDLAAMARYAQEVVRLDFGATPAIDAQAALAAYARDSHRACCHCGSGFPTGKWMAGQVPPNVAVQSFSNRLPGGSAAEPKRHVCSVCRTQFTLEKLTHRALKTSHTTFLFLFPYAFYPVAYLQAVRDAVADLLAEDTSVLFPQTDEAIRAAVEDGRFELPVLRRNKQGGPYSNGIVLPQFAETIGNTLLFPLNCPGDAEDERFLFALQNALLLQRFVGCRVALGRTPVPALGPHEFADLFVDGVPLGFHGLVPQPDLDLAALDRLWSDIGTLHGLKRQLYNPEREEDPLRSLARALDSPRRLGVFAAVDRLVQHKAAQGRAPGDQAAARALGLSRKVLPLLCRLLEGEESMQALRRLAEMAWEGHIIGRSLERNSLLKPFDMLLDALQDRSPAFGDDTLRAQLVEDIFRHLEVIAPDEYRIGRTKREKVKEYVAQFFEGVLGEVYGGRLTRLLADKANLRSAYLFYLRERIPSRGHPADAAG